MLPTRLARILLVEDEALVAQTLVEILKRDRHTVHHIMDGAEAWKHLQEDINRYDLLIIDVNLPGLERDRTGHTRAGAAFWRQGVHHEWTLCDQPTYGHWRVSRLTTR